MPEGIGLRLGVKILDHVIAGRELGSCGPYFSFR